jgi:hypothetical protein
MEAPVPGLVALLLSLLLASPVHAEEAAAKTIGELYKARMALVGKQVTVQGKVVKVNNQIMNKNWVHIQDGTGDPAAGTQDLTVTSQDSAAVGDRVTVTGTVTVDRDFGYGYQYPLLVEQAKISPAR